MKKNRKNNKTKKYLTNFRNKMIKASRSKDYFIKMFNDVTKVECIIYSILALCILFVNPLSPDPFMLFVIECVIYIIINLIVLLWFSYLINDCDNHKKHLNKFEQIQTALNVNGNNITIAYIERYIEEYKFQKNEHLEEIIWGVIALVSCVILSL
jgi:hypothetical protein